MFKVNDKVKNKDTVGGGGWGHIFGGAFIQEHINRILRYIFPIHIFDIA